MGQPKLSPTPPKPIKKSYKEYPPAPVKDSVNFTSFLDRLIFLKSRRDRKIKEVENKNKAAVANWELQKKTIDNINNQIDKDFEKYEMSKWNNDVLEWAKREKAFSQEQDAFNANIDKMKEAYFSQNVDSIIAYCRIVLNNSKYPSSFPKNFELEYNPDNRILITEYELPPMEAFPKIKKMKYVAARNEFKEIYMVESQLNKIFDDAIYKITLRTIYELFQADKANAIDAVSFNGWVKAINKANGKEETNCILSIQVKKDEFNKIALSNEQARAPCALGTGMN